MGHDEGRLSRTICAWDNAPLPISADRNDSMSTGSSCEGHRPIKCLSTHRYASVDYPTISREV
jgi:hypothetical protein